MSDGHEYVFKKEADYKRKNKKLSNNEVDNNKRAVFETRSCKALSGGVKVVTGK